MIVRKEDLSELSTEGDGVLHRCGCHIGLCSEINTGSDPAIDQEDRAQDAVLAELSKEAERN